MRKLFTFLLTVSLTALIAGSAVAVPRLQTYIVGSEYTTTAQGEGSWMTSNSSFDLKVAGYWSAAAERPPFYDFMGVGLLIGVPRDETGSIFINGMEITSFYNAPSGLAATSFGSQEPMRYAKINMRGVGFIDNNQHDAWHYDHGQIHSPGWGDELLVDVAVEGFSWSHFGAFGISRFGEALVTPGNRDGGYSGGGSGSGHGSGSHAAPEPGTLSLLGLGLIGLAPFLKKRKSRP